MNRKVLHFSFLIFLYYLIVTEKYSIATRELRNELPIIGVLSQEISHDLSQVYPGRYHSYIAASYVKFLEGAGARVVPIWIGKDDSYYRDLMSNINGVLLPGGTTYFNVRNGYSDAGDKIYSIAKDLNDKGDYFPILGICLGFELLTYLAANRVEHRTNCSSMNQPLPLEFTPHYNQTRMFRDASKEVIEILRTENVTGNYHKFCVTESDLKRVDLHDQFQIMSLNYDRNQLRFISSLEHKNYPFYGLQFHPEKNLYEWIKGKNIPHGRNAAIVGQFFANFFVGEASKNHHEFKSEQEEMTKLIYNYPVTYTALTSKSSFVQSYLFAGQ